MRKMTLGVASAALAGAAALTVAGAPAASADGPLNPDGKVHAWTGTYRNGAHCAWGGNSSDWGTCANAARSVENAGYNVGPTAVRLYYDYGHNGAYACIARGDRWMDLPLGRERFSFYGNNGDGLNAAVDHNVPSHTWNYNCS